MRTHTRASTLARLRILALALDSSGNPLISYYDYSNADLKLAHCSDANCSTGNSIQTINSAGDVGFDAGLELGSSGNPVISYYDSSNGDLKLASLVETDATPPVIMPNVTGTLGNNGWYTSDVTVSWSLADNQSAIDTQTGCGPSTVSSDSSGVTFTCTAVARAARATNRSRSNATPPRRRSPRPSVQTRSSWAVGPR